MHTIDYRHHPIIVVHTIEPMMKADVEAITVAAQALIDQGQHFALVMVSDGGDSKERERGANGLLMQWAKANKAAMEAYCAGMASVVPSSALLAVYQPMMKVIGARMYGFPLATFTSEAEARAWAGQPMAALTA